jgi:hypothetical protein
LQQQQQKCPGPEKLIVEFYQSFKELTAFSSNYSMKCKEKKLKQTHSTKPVLP